MKLKHIIATIALVSLTSCATSGVSTKATQAATTPEQAISRLKEGNSRFVAGKSQNLNHLAQLKKTAKGQAPFAAVLSCIDSRTSSEIIFDQGIGDIFNARVAGNVLNDDLLGSLEFATAKAGAKAILVVGHTSCGAVSGACADAKIGHVTGLLDKIKPAVRKASRVSDAGKGDAGFEDRVAAENVKMVVSQIRSRSSLIRDLERQGKLTIQGGLHHLDTGKVDFFQ